MNCYAERLEHRAVIVRKGVRNRKQAALTPCNPLTHGTICFAMTCKDQMGAEVWMTMIAEFAMPTGNRGVDCHTLTITRHPCELMSQYKWTFELRIADAAFAKPVKIRAAHANRFDADQLFPVTRHRNFFFMKL